MSVRAAIRHRAVESLKRIGTDAGERVYPSMIRPLWGEDLPCVLVYTRREDAEVFDVAPRSYDRTLALAVEVVAKGEGADDGLLDDTLDRVAYQVEMVFNEDQTLGGLCESVLLKSTEVTLNMDGEEITGSAVMTFDVRYITDAVASGAVSPNLLTPWHRAGVEMKPSGSLGDTPTEKDEVELEHE